MGGRKKHPIAICLMLITELVCVVTLMREWTGLRIFGMTIAQCISKATHIHVGSAVTQSHVADFDFWGTSIGRDRDLASLDWYTLLFFIVSSLSVISYDIDLGVLVTTWTWMCKIFYYAFFVYWYIGTGFPNLRIHHESNHRTLHVHWLFFIVSPLSVIS